MQWHVLFVSLCVVGAVVPGASADVLFRSFDDQLLGETLGDVSIARNVVRSQPGALLLSGAPGDPARLVQDLGLPCASGTLTQLRFLIPDTEEITGRVGLVDLTSPSGGVAHVGVANPDSIDVGLPGQPGYAPAAFSAPRGTWHLLEVTTVDDVMHVSVDGGAPATFPLENADVPTQLAHSVEGVTEPLRAYIDDVRVTPLVDRFFDRFDVSTWTNPFHAPNEVVALSGAKYHSTSTSMYVRSVDNDDGLGAGIWHEFPLPTCLMSRLVGVGTTVWFHLPPQPWGDAGFSLTQIADRMSDYPQVVWAHVGDFDGDRRIEFANGATGGAVQTTTAIPFGGWHRLDVDIRPKEIQVDVDSYPGLFSGADLLLEVDVELDGVAVGTFPAPLSALPMGAAYLGTAWTDETKSDDFVSYWDDFQVRAELAAPLCGDGRKVFDAVDGVLAFDQAWLDGETGIERLTIDPGTGEVDVTGTGLLGTSWLEDGSYPTAYKMVTTGGLELLQTCDVVRDMLPPDLALDTPVVPPSGWLPAGSTVDAGAVDAGTGVEAIAARFDGAPWDSAAVQQRQIALPAGEHTLDVQAVDGFGRTSAVESFAFKVDAGPPALEIAYPRAGRVVLPGGGQVGIASTPTNVLVGRSITMTGLADDPHSGLASVGVTLNGEAVPVEGTDSWSATMTFRPGLSTVRVTATDVAGQSTVLVRTFLATG